MYEQQNFFDLQENESFNDPKSWLSGAEEEEHLSSQSSQQPLSSYSNTNNGSSNFDRVLYKNLVEMVPLVQSLMDRKANTSFTRRASLIYTKTPAINKNSEPKGRKASQSIPAKKRGIFGENETNKKVSTDEYSILTARTSAGDPLLMLQEQVESLQKKLLEKDELLKSTENTMGQLASLQVKLDELECQVAGKDALIKSVHLQLSDAKIKLADKQAALEKLQWEASISNRKAEQLREDLESMQEEVSIFMTLLEGLTMSESSPHSVDYDATPYDLDQLSYIDDMNEIEMQQMEEAREAYMLALSSAKESQEEESLEIAVNARLRLQSLVFKPKSENLYDVTHNNEIYEASPAEMTVY
ncbi:Microtubule binding protein 2c [Thalictrum thalictroides]|uniref:Microtubule binding protein 2c n=1 Tax=Thalictrum thalictroides TaxID=46969 RepID=A0A7J6VI67_THATH|nr:Microtubule binding protein 2c [Thalictrum thalictroides]